MELRYPAQRYFSAVRQGEEPLPPGPEATWLAITRRQYVVRHYELSRGAHELLQSVLAGETVGEAICRAAEAAGPDVERLSANVGAWFRQWAAADFFRALEIDK